VNFASRLSFSKQQITLKDLVKPSLKPSEKAAINRALKKAHKDQDNLKRKALQS